MASETNQPGSGQRSDPKRPVAIGPHVVSDRQVAALREILSGSEWARNFRDRFFRKVQRTSDSGHHLWTAAKKNGGYGFQVACLPFGKVPVLAHRIALAYSIGAPAPGQTANHRNECHTPSCVNPAHLYWGTQQDNVADQVALQTFTGSRNSQSKLTERDVVAMRRLFRSGEFTQRELAAKYGTSQVAVKYALCGQQWGHVPDAISPDETHRIRHARRQRELETERNRNARVQLDWQMQGRDSLGRSREQVGELRLSTLQSARAAVYRGEALGEAVRHAAQLSLTFTVTASALSKAKASLENESPDADVVRRRSLELLDRAIEVAGGRKPRRGGWTLTNHRSNE